MRRERIQVMENQIMIEKQGILCIIFLKVTGRWYRLAKQDFSTKVMLYHNDVFSDVINGLIFESLTLMKTD